MPDWTYMVPLSTRALIRCRKQNRTHTRTQKKKKTTDGWAGKKENQRISTATAKPLPFSRVSNKRLPAPFTSLSDAGLGTECGCRFIIHLPLQGPVPSNSPSKPPACPPLHYGVSTMVLLWKLQPLQRQMLAVIDLFHIAASRTHTHRCFCHKSSCGKRQTDVFLGSIFRGRG